MDVENISEKKPKISMSMGCHPDQVKQFNEDLKHHGVKGAHYMPNGHPIFHSKKAEHDFRRVTGSVNPDGGFGDYTGGSR